VEVNVPPLDGPHDAYNRNALYFECTACLTDQDGKPGIGANLLPGLLSEDYSKLTYLLLRSPSVRLSIWNDNKTDFPWVSGRAYPEGDVSTNVMSGLKKYINMDMAFEPLYEVQPNSGLYAAHFIGRLPILAILAGEMKLGRVTRDNGASERQFVNTSAEVRWKGAFCLLGAILGVLMLLIATVIIWCRHVFVREDDSYLSAARLLKSAMENVKKGSVATGSDIAEHLGENGMRMRYGARKRSRKIEMYVVDLSEDATLPFPRGQYDRVIE
jgi:hypothetical protein